MFLSSGILGAALTGILPKPKCTVYTNLACDGNMMTFPYLKQTYELPGFYIDVPYEKNQDSVRYVAGQLRELKRFLEEVTGKKIPEEAVQKAVSNSRKAAVNYQRQLALRKDHDPVSSMTNELYAIFMCHLAGGIRSVCQIYGTVTGRCKESSERGRTSCSVDAYYAIFAGAGKGSFQLQ